jgi:hypothetical protein
MNIYSAVERLERLMWEKTRIEREIVEMNIIIDRLSESEKENFFGREEKKNFLEGSGLINYN